MTKKYPPFVRPVENKNVFFLGTFSTRVTIYSQQVRALELIHKLTKDGIILKDSKIAIIGGGVGGITAAAAAAVAVPELANIEIFERSQIPIPIQFESKDRYIHPKIYDWPSRGSTTEDADLPIMNWQAGSADEVACQIRNEFIDLYFDRMVKFNSGCHVINIKLDNNSNMARVQTLGSLHFDRLFDIVIVAVGFGLELTAVNGTTYWDATFFAKSFDTYFSSSREIFTVLVSGTGDGGLIDFALASFNGLSHKYIIDVIDNLVQGTSLRNDLIDINRRSLEDKENFDILEAFNHLRIPPAFYDKIIKLQRKKTRVILHSRKKSIFRWDTSLINKFVCFLIYKSSGALPDSSREFITLVKIDDIDYDKSNVTLSNGRVINVDRVFLRHGPKRDENLQPFLDLTNNVSFRHGGEESTPKLSKEVHKFFTAAAKFVSPTIEVVESHFESPKKDKDVENYAPVVLCNLLPFSQNSDVNFRSNLILGSITHDKITIPGSMILKNNYIASHIKNFMPLIKSGVLLPDLRDSVKNFRDYVDTVIGKSAQDWQREISDALDKACPHPLRFEAESTSKNFIDTLRQYLIEFIEVNNTSTQKSIDNYKKFLDNIGKATTSNAAKEIATKSKESEEIVSLIDYLYCICGAMSLNAHAHIPDNVFRSFRNFSNKYTEWESHTLFVNSSAMVLANIDMNAISQLDERSILSLRTDRRVKDIRQLFSKISQNLLSDRDIGGINSWNNEALRRKIREILIHIETVENKTVNHRERKLNEVGIIETKKHISFYRASMSTPLRVYFDCMRYQNR